MTTTQTHAEAIMEAVAIAQRDLLPGDEAEVVVCAGPPACLRSVAAQLKAMKQGCFRCARVVVGEELPRA